MEALVLFKAASAVGILVITIVASFLPLRLREADPHVRENFLAHFSFFTGGVFLGAGLLHLLPDAMEMNPFEDLKFPFVYFLVCLGFVFIWGVETINSTQIRKSVMVAVTAKAVDDGGASICSVRVDPVTTYSSSLSISSSNAALQSSAPGLKQESADEGVLSHSYQNDVSSSKKHKCAAHDSSVDHSGIHEDVCVGDMGFGHHSPPIKLLSHSHSHPSLACSSSSFSHSQPVTVTTDNNDKKTNSSSTDHSHDDDSHNHSHSHDGDSHNHSHNHSHSHDGDSHSHSHSHNDDSTRHSHNHSDCEHQQLLPKPSSQSAEPHAQLHDHTHEHVHHHHLIIPENASIFLPLMLAVVFSIHSLVEGLALGVQKTLGTAALSVLVAILAHKFVEALTVGSNFVKEKVAFSRSAPVIFVYCLMTPLGVFLGMLLQDIVEDTKMLQCVLQSVATGSFMFLAVHEIQDEHSVHLVKPTRQVFLFLLGICFMTLLTLVE